MPRPLVAVALLALPLAAAGELPAKRRGELTEFVRQDCGSCHGLTLKGGLGPSLEPAALAGKDAAYLSFVILRGRPGTPMPPWRDHLTQDEADWIAHALKRGLR
jgi:cytochrome c55X